MPFYFFKCPNCKWSERKFVSPTKTVECAICHETMQKEFGVPMPVRAMELADERRGISVPQGLEKMIEDRAVQSEKKGRFSEDEGDPV